MKKTMKQILIALKVIFLLLLYNCESNNDQFEEIAVVYITPDVESAIYKPNDYVTFQAKAYPVDAEVSWYLDGEKAGSGLLFEKKMLGFGTKALKVTVSKGDLYAEKSIKLVVNDPVVIKTPWPAEFVSRPNVQKLFSVDVITQDPTYKWFINGEQVSTDETLAYTFTELGEYDIAVEITKSDTVRLEAKVIVDDQFTPKNYNKIVVGVVGPGTVLNSDQLNATSHIMHYGYYVGNTDAINTWKGEAKSVVDFAHTNNNYAIMHVSNQNTTMDSGSAYGPYNLSNEILTNGDTLIDEIIALYQEYDYDGINIDCSQEIAIYQQDATVLPQIGDWILKLKEALTENSLGNKFLTMSVYGNWNQDTIGYPELISKVSDDIDYVFYSVLGYLQLEKQNHNPVEVVVPSRVSTFPSEKVVLGLSSVAIKWDIPDGTEVNWGNVWSFASWLPYNTINTTYPQLFETGEAENGDIKLDGMSKIETVASFIDTYNYAGAFVLDLGGDTSNSKSIVTNISSKLGN